MNRYPINVDKIKEEAFHNFLMYLLHRQDWEDNDSDNLFDEIIAWSQVWEDWTEKYRISIAFFDKLRHDAPQLVISFLSCSLWEN